MSTNDTDMEPCLGGALAQSGKVALNPKWQRIAMQMTWCLNRDMGFKLLTLLNAYCPHEDAVRDAADELIHADYMSVVRVAELRALAHRYVPPSAMRRFGFAYMPAEAQRVRGPQSRPSVGLYENFGLIGHSRSRSRVSPESTRHSIMADQIVDDLRASQDASNAELIELSSPITQEILAETTERFLHTEDASVLGVELCRCYPGLPPGSFCAYCNLPT